jgi:hypothetical protein
MRLIITTKRIAREKATGMTVRSGFCVRYNSRGIQKANANIATGVFTARATK